MSYGAQVGKRLSAGVHNAAWWNPEVSVGFRKWRGGIRKLGKGVSGSAKGFADSARVEEW